MPPLLVCGQTLLPTGSQITASDHRQVEVALLEFAESQWLTGDIKEIDCTDAYIAANFEGGTGPTAGLGIVGGEREGWAICNGNNLTKNRGGRTSIGYDDTNYAVMGAIGGFTDSAVIDHRHEYQDAYFAEVNGHKPNGAIAGSGDTDGDNGYYYRNRNGAVSSSPPPIGYRPLTDNPEYSQGSGLNKNMQPYIVTLFIQKI
jgi:hypothetical protein